MTEKQHVTFLAVGTVGTKEWICEVPGKGIRAQSIVGNEAGKKVN